MKHMQTNFKSQSQTNSAPKNKDHELLINYQKQNQKVIFGHLIKNHHFWASVGQQLYRGSKIYLQMIYNSFQVSGVSWNFEIQGTKWTFLVLLYQQTLYVTNTKSESVRLDTKEMQEGRRGMEGTKKGNKITNQSVFGSFRVYSVYTKLVCAHLFGQGKKGRKGNNKKYLVSSLFL